MIGFDLRDAVRGLLNDRLYAALVVLTLALTIGATTAVFSIVNGVLLKPLAYPDAGRLVSIREVVREVADRYPTLPANARHFREWRNRSTSFAAMAELDYANTNLTGAGEPLQVTRVRASGTLFDVLGTGVALGRGLVRDDERSDRPPVAVIAHALWTDRFGADPAVLGRVLTLGGRPYTVVGVLAPGFDLPSYDILSGTGSLTSRVDVIVPERMVVDDLEWMGVFNYPVVARLKPGVTLTQARAEIDVVQQGIAEIAARQIHGPVGLRAVITPLDESIVGRVRLGLVLLLSAVAAVVLIACANLANLSLTRALSRSRETAVRAALGASHRRLVLGTVLEQVLLAIGGGVLGVAVARLCIDLFVRTAPVDLPRVGEVSIDGRVLAFAAVTSVVAGLLVGVVPASRVARSDLQDALRAGGHGATDRGGLRTRAVLLAVQVGLSVTLLAAAGLLAASFVRLLGIDPGFSPTGVVSVQIAPPAVRYGDVAPRAALYDRVMDRVRMLPGIVSASWASQLPLTGEWWVDKLVRLEGRRPDAQDPSANFRFVGPDYFRTLSIPLTRGRAFDAADRNGAAVPAVISARAAATVWPGEDPIGRRFRRSDPQQPKPFEVVGVVADGHATALDAESPLMIYLPYWFNNEGKSILIVRTAGSAAGVLPELRRIVRDTDPEIAIADAKPLQTVVDGALAGRRYQMWLFVAFGLSALAIAALGVYATTAYGVSRRRREMNIRMALGARAAQVFGLVVRQTAVPVGVGVLAGAAGALAVGSAMAALLFEVRPHDVRVLGGAAVFVAAIGVIATGAAARQALRVNPAAALRDE